MLIVENKEGLQQLLDTIEKKNSKNGLGLNSKNTEVMVANRNNECPQINIFINGNKVKQRDQLKYLGSLISGDGRNNTEIESRIEGAETSFERMKSILKWFFFSLFK